jgi:hypothetical protein
MPNETATRLTHAQIREVCGADRNAKECECPCCGGHLLLFKTDEFSCKGDSKNDPCTPEAVAIELRRRIDSGEPLTPATSKPKKLKPSAMPDWNGYTLDEHCATKKLNRDVLQRLHDVCEMAYKGKTVVGWRYHDADGKVLATKLRLSSDSHDTLFQPADPHIPYGLANPFLKNLKPGYDLIITEGESDCQTFCCWGLLAIGISGSNGWLPEFAELPIILNAGRVFISEDRKGGAGFAAKILKDLPQAFVLRWADLDVDDPSDLHLKYYESLEDPAAVFEPNPFFQSLEVAIKHATLQKALRQPKTDRPKPTIRDEAFYGLAGEVIRLLEPVLETDRAAILSNFLATAGVLFQHEAYSKVVADRHYPADFYLTVGQSAVSRKGTTTNAMLEVIERVQPGFKKRIIRGLSTGQGLIQALIRKKPGDGEDQDEDAIPEAIAAAVLVEISEFSELLAVMKREENTLTATMRNAWDGVPLAVMTRKDPLKVQNVSIATVAHITVRELLAKLTSVDRANGFANRFLFVWSERVKLLPRGDMSHLNCSGVVVKLHKVIEQAKGVGEIARDDDAEELWAEEYKRLTARGDQMIDALLSRADAHVVRLSCLYALLDGSKVIRREHLQAALAFWDYCEASVRFVFDQPDAIDEKILRKLEDGPLTTAEIQRQVFSGNLTAVEVTARMTSLAEKRLVYRGPKEFKHKTYEGWHISDGR